MMTISELEEAYEQAHVRLLRGELDDEEFKADVEALRYEDDLGRQWKIGWYTGKWYKHDQGRWIQDVPVERRPGKAPLTAPSHHRFDSSTQRLGRRSRAVWLAAGIACLLLVASVLLVLGLSGTGLPAAQVAGGPAASSPTFTLPVASRAAAMVEPQPSPTSAPATATEAPKPLPTTRAPSSPLPSPAVTITGTPSPTPSATASPVPSATETRAAPPPTALPPLSGQIFFPVYDPNPDRRTMDIYSVLLPSGRPRIVVGQASQPALSRDGKRLAFRSWDAAQRGILVRELLVGNTWTWVNYGEAARPSWGPDNNAIVFASQQESDRRWRLYRTLGLEIDRVRRHGGDIFGRVPAWLADGRIVFWDCPEDKCGLYAMQSDGTSPVRLTMAEHDTAPAPSPDGSQVAFMSNRDGNWEVYSVDMKRPEGLEGEGIIRLTNNAARDGLPTWSPDGRWLAFVTDRDGVWAVWVTSPDGSNQFKLFNLGGPLDGQIAAVTADDQHGWTWESMAWGP